MFAEEYSRRNSLGVHGETVSPYRRAAMEAERLLASDEGIVRRIRQDEPDLRSWTADLLVRHGVDATLAATLCQPFVREGGSRAA
ncbi:hypothetical protein RB623_29135 [Mesorhizobium sp. LHD-90]|uniref:hypothetical protein n=1 Tax=Mesorhizobium sp. LHD-90 TaxID=3071414 RepID=UPI0027E16BA2|nr:hypothetical protein [Mesorhizobium sp. LHD-90]MDQ6438137.1 hypothetical protein [Mesorhizobium sp. LHD-90]